MTESTHDHAHETPSYDDVNTPVIVLVGAIAALVTLLTIMFVQGLCYHWQNSFLRKRSMEAGNMPAAVEIDRQKAMLNGEDGLLSIEDGMKNVVSRFGK